MDYNTFLQSISADQPPAGATDLLKALWYDKNGDWEASHNIAQDIHDRNGSWVHAYLHRREGDISNARYWYRLANKPEFSGSLDDEWEALVRTFVNG